MRHFLLFSVSIFCLTLFAFSGLSRVYAATIFSQTDQPYGKSYDSWAAEFWNKWIAKNIQQATPKQGGCLTVNNDNKSESMVMLMETADVNTPPVQNCQISASQGILIPLWVGWCDTGTNKGASDQQLFVCAQKQNLGNIGSDIKVDGTQVAKLDVSRTVSPGTGSVNYKINSLSNVIQSTSKPFTLIIPADTHKPNQVAGTWRAVSDGWWVFLKPLAPGMHTVFYNIRVLPTGALTSPGTNVHFADITYNLDVIK